MTATRPTMRQGELGTRPRQLHNGLGLTVEEVGEKLLCSATKISRVETGACRPSLHDVRKLCRPYGMNEVGTAELVELAKMAEQGRWSQYSNLKLDPYIWLEQEAASVTCSSMYYVSALRQTKTYGYRMIKIIKPKMDLEIRKQRVQALLRQQQLLEQATRPRYRVLPVKAVLYRRVDGPAVIVTQFEEIPKLEQDGKATVQVMPFKTGARAAQDTNFLFLDLQDSRPVVFVEGPTANLYIKRDSDLDRYPEAVEYLRDEALGPRGSGAFIAGIQKNYASK